MFAENALIDIDQRSLDEVIEQPGKWQDFGAFHLKFEKWDKILHSIPLYARGYGGLISIKNLTLDYWNNKLLKLLGPTLGAY